MPIPRCVLCKRRWTTKNIKFFYVPKNSDIRTGWSKICNQALSNTSRICELHFKQEHIYNVKKSDYRSKLLTKEAYPTLFLTEDELKNLPEAKSPSPLPLMFKDDVVENTFQLINEEVFDSTSNVISAPLEELPKELEFETGTCHRSTQTGFLDSGATCALINVSKDYMVYSVCCVLCSEQFSLWNWSDFVQHITDKHRYKGHIFFDSCTDPPILKANVTENKNVYDDSIRKEESDNEDRKVHEISDEFIESHLSYDDFDYSDNDKTEEEEEDDEESISNGSWEISNSRFGKGVNEIFIESTESSLVLSFIEFLQSYPVLWEKPEKNIDIYDASALELRAKFNKKHQLSISSMGIHNSIVRIREWYQKVLGEKSSNKLIHPQDEYFKKCSEFLPALVVDKTSLISQYGRKTCEICFSTLKDGHELQMHMIIRHKILNFPVDELRYETDKMECQICGEHFSSRQLYLVHQGSHNLPKFQCNICYRIFEKKAQYAEHMKAHYNRRDYVCEQCGKAFVRRSNFEMHMKRHNGIKIECKICNRKFSDFTQIGNHRKNYHMVLEGTNEELSQLKRRSSKHPFVICPITKQARYECQLCGKNYAYLGGLRKHEIVIHGLTTPKRHRRRRINRDCTQSIKEEKSSNDDEAKVGIIDMHLDPTENLQYQLINFGD